jgi:hypothetical protein
MIKINFFLFIGFLNLSLCQSPELELGKVTWLRDLDKAKTASQLQQKPILILFQEVPGCQTCRNYGSQVLSHPLIVEAIETYFIPLCILNNKKGRDAEVLKLFSEPSWNNPVVRIVDTQLNPVVERLHNNYSSYGLVSKLNASLIKQGIRIPEYLDLLEKELKAHSTGLNHATIGMYCFWSGEKTYGAIPGVVSTNAGFMNGNEVVEILYDPREINLRDIIRIGKKNKTADKIFLDPNVKTDLDLPTEHKADFKTDPESKYYIYQSDYKFIPMTALQAARINSLLAQGKSCEHLLSPRQITRYKHLKSIPASQRKNQIGRDIIQAWYE